MTHVTRTGSAKETGQDKLGRVVWITGASSGIGKAVAEKLAARGLKVAVSARSEAPLNALAATYPTITAYPLDVTDADGVKGVIDTIERDIGPIDLAIFCAAVWKVLDVEELDVEAVQTGMSVNFNGTVATLIPLLHRMMARESGHVGVVASVAGYRGLPRAAAYGPTKAALINLVETLSPDLARHNVDISIINPGFVDTPMTQDNDFPMPFIVQVEDAADRIIAGLEKRAFEVAFPWQLVTILKVLSVIPNRLFLYLMRRFVARAPSERGNPDG